MKNKLSFLASLEYAQMEPEKVCLQLSELGYDGVEWTLSHFNPRTKSVRDLIDLVQITHKHDLQVSEVVVQQDIVCQDEKERKSRIGMVLECIDAATQTGVTTINVFTGPCAWDATAPRIGVGIKEGEAWQMVFDAYDRFVKSAEQKHIHLAVEGVFGMLCHDYYTTKVLIDHYDSDYLGVNYDPSHDVLYEHLDVGWIVRQWGQKIKHVHLKDAVGVPTMGKLIFPVLGEGAVDWHGLFAALKEIGYDGFMSVEFESFIYYENILKRDPFAAARLSLLNFKALTGG